MAGQRARFRAPVSPQDARRMRRAFAGHLGPKGRSLSDRDGRHKGGHDRLPHGFGEMRQPMVTEALKVSVAGGITSWDGAAAAVSAAAA